MSEDLDEIRQIIDDLKAKRYTLRDLRAFRANPKVVRFPWTDQKITYLDGEVHSVRLLSLDAVSWVECFTGTTKQCVLHLSASKLKGEAESILPLEEPTYVGPQPYLFHNPDGNSSVLVVVKHGNADHRNLTGKIDRYAVRPGLAVVIGDTEHGQRRMVVWDREYKLLWSKDFVGEGFLVGDILICPDERKLMPVWDKEQSRFIDFPKDLPDCDFLEGAHHRGLPCVLVRRKSDGRFGVISCMRAEVKWLHESVVEADGLAMDANSSYYLRVKQNDGQMSIIRNGVMRFMYCLGAKETSKPFVSDTLVASVIVDADGKTGININVYSDQVRIEGDFEIDGEGPPSTFPYLIERDESGLLYSVVSLERVEPGKWRKVTHPGMNELAVVLHLKKCREGRPHIAGRLDGRTLIDYGMPGYLNFSVEGEADFRKVLIWPANEIETHWKMLVPVPIPGSNRWRVTDGEMDFGPTLSEIYGMAVNPSSNRLIIVGRDSKMVRCYDCRIE